MDGGAGQLGCALEVMDETGVSFPVAGMVKDDRHRTRGLLLPGEKDPVPIDEDCFRLITRIQDEAHRFAIDYHRLLRRKEAARSVLDDIPGIGPKRRAALLRAFGGIVGLFPRQNIRAIRKDRSGNTRYSDKAENEAVFLGSRVQCL